MRKSLLKLSLWPLLATTLVGCGYNTPVGGISPNIVVITPTVTVAPLSTAPVTTVGPTTTTAVTTSAPDTTPAKTTLPPLALNPDGTYTVKAGDTLSGIASRLKVDLDELITLNNLKDPDNLKIDQILKVPPRKQ